MREAGSSRCPANESIFERTVTERTVTMDKTPGKTPGTPSGTMATSSSSNAEQVHSELTTTLASADSTAADRIQNLQLVHQARVSRLSRTAASLKAQYGPNDPGVKAAEAAVAVTTTTVGRVAMVYQQQKTTTPQVAKNGWALHGRVFDAQLQPVSGFTVFLVDGQKTYQQDIGFAYTDDTGYFLLSDSGTQSQDQSKTQGAAPAQLFLEIADTKSQPVYLSATPFQPVLGSATYQNVTLPSGGQAIGGPPAAIRKVALPKKSKVVKS